MTFTKPNQKGKTVKPSKQRRRRYTAALHLKQKQMGVHLSPELRKKYRFRSITVRKGDKVKIERGQFKSREGKVDRLDLRRERVWVADAGTTKKDGTKILSPLHPSNLMLVALDLNDKKRKMKIESKMKGTAS